MGNLWACIAGFFSSYKACCTSYRVWAPIYSRMTAHSPNTSGWRLHFHKRSCSGVPKQHKLEGILVRSSPTSPGTPTSCFHSPNSTISLGAIASCAQECVVPYQRSHLLRRLLRQDPMSQEFPVVGAGDLMHFPDGWESSPTQPSCELCSALPRVPGTWQCG